YESEHAGVHIEIESNPDLASEIPMRLANGSDDDIFFSHGISWEKAAVQGQLERLDTLYEQVVEDDVIFADKVEKSLLSTASFNNHYYKVPWTNGAGGIVYNELLFEKYGWEVPETYEELVTLCQTIYDAKIKINPNDNKPNAQTIKPFIWSQETYYWDYLVFDWWAQYAGTDFFDEYVKLESPEVFNPTTYPGQYKAFRDWVNLVAKNPWQSVDDSVGKQYMAAQMDFANGLAAMIPNAQWIEQEMSGNIDPSKVKMRLMSSPFVAEAKTDNMGKPIKVNYAVGAGDSIIIPATSQNKSLAKKFLLFLARNDNLKLFTEKTNGVMLGFDYGTVDFSNSNLTAFAQDVIKINQESIKFNLYSNSLLRLDGKVGLEWPPENLQYYASFFNYYNNTNYFNNPNTFAEKNVLEIFTSAYNEIKNKWNGWLSEVN
ncbi:MAG: extracellular solute-binding protein, partial [Bacillales bacterium]|nr:extracellular solute-binding protein [Bacillales bacterium]